MTTTFKPGDRVRQIRTRNEYVVAEVRAAGERLSFESFEHVGFFNSHAFELISPSTTPPSPATTREAILAEASALIVGDRQADYGPPSESMQRIATGWSVILGTDVEQWQVAAAMAWLKIARAVETPTKRDSWVDGAGYMAIAAEVAGA